MKLRENCENMARNRLSPLSSSSALVESIFGRTVREILKMQDPLEIEVTRIMERVNALAELALQAGRYAGKEEAVKRIMQMPEFGPKYFNSKKLPSEDNHVKVVEAKLNRAEYESMMMVIGGHVQRQQEMCKEYDSSMVYLDISEYELWKDGVDLVVKKVVWDLLANRLYLNLFDLVEQAILLSPDTAQVIFWELKRSVDSFKDDPKFEGDLVKRLIERMLMGLRHLDHVNRYWMEVGIDFSDPEKKKALVREHNLEAYIMSKIRQKRKGKKIDWEREKKIFVEAGLLR